MQIPGVPVIGGFSITSPSSELRSDSTIDLAVKFSKHPPALWLHDRCQRGSVVQVRFGGEFYFCPDSDPSPLLLIGGGVGINPLHSILAETIIRDSQTSAGLRPLALLYSASTEDELLFKNKFLNTAGHVELFASERPPSNPRIKGRRMAEEDVERALAYLPKGQVAAYICGPLEFIQFAESALLKFHLTQERIHYEKWQ